MKILRASQLLLCLSEINTGFFKLTAKDINTLCENLRLQQIDNALSFYDFEELSSYFPEEIKITATEISVTPSEHLLHRIRHIEFFNCSQINNDLVLDFLDDLNRHE